MKTKPKYKAVRSKDPYACSVESARDIICQRCTWTGAQKIARALNAMEKPKAKPFKFDWSGVDPKYKWAAMDSDGAWYAFDITPTSGTYAWKPTDHSNKYVERKPPYPGDWRDSLQKRR